MGKLNEDDEQFVDDGPPKPQAGSDQAKGDSQDADGEGGGSEGGDAAAAPSDNGAMTVSLTNLKKLDDGRFELKWGGSVYYGASAQEVVEKAQEGAVNKDKAWTAKKAKEALTSADKTAAGDVDEIPPAPDMGTVVSNVFSRKRLDTSFANFRAADWKQLKEDKGLDDMDILDLKSQVRDALAQADVEFNNQNAAWLNKLEHIEARTEVSQILADNNVDPEEYAERYYEILMAENKRAKTERGGLMRASRIVSAVWADIHKMKLQRQGDDISRRSKETEAQKLERERLEKIKAQAGSKGAASGGSKGKAPTILNLKNATAEAIKRIDSGKL